MSDPAKYRSKEEVQKMREERDCIEMVRKRLLETWKMPEEELKAVDAKVREIVNEAAEFAQHDPEPDPAELWTNVLSDRIERLRRRDKLSAMILHSGR